MAEQPCLVVTADEKLERDHFVRRLKSLVELTMGKDLRKRCSMVGGFSYDPVGLLCVWLFGMMQGERSSRKLEDLCRYDARYEFLTSSCRPDHTTLARFRTSLGEDLDELLSRICQEAEERGFLKRRCMSLDGTKVPARSSQWNKARKQSEQEDAGLEEACMMVSHGEFLIGYNVQTGVDIDSNLVVGYFVSTQPDDFDQMGDALPAIERQSGGLPEEVVADRGYGSPTNAMALEQAGMVGYLPAKGPSAVPTFTKGEDGQFCCLAGHIPTVSNWYDRKRHHDYFVLRVSRCTHCPLKGDCPGKGERQRAMKRQKDDVTGAKDRAAARSRTPQGRTLMKRRGATVERVFAVIKTKYGLNRFSLFGQTKASIEFGIAMLAYDIERLLSLFLRVFWLLFGRQRPHFDTICA